MHKKVIFSAINLALGPPDGQGGMTTDDIQLITFPMFHVGGLNHLIVDISLGQTMVLTEVVKPKIILQLIEKEKVTILDAVPSVLLKLISSSYIGKYDTSSIRMVRGGGGVTSATLKEKLKVTFDVIGVGEGYGMTEASSSVVGISPEESTKKGASCIGRQYMNVEVRIINDNGSDVRPDEVGTIMLYGPTIMKRYYKDEQRTKQAFKEGWLCTNDMATVDEEGYIYFRGRKDDMFISGGENVYPAEIEGILLTHPKVKDVAVIGVPHELWGETAKAILVLKDGETMTLEEIIEYCTEKMANFKRPRIVHFVSELPCNAAGKVLRRLLRECHGAAGSG